MWDRRWSDRLRRTISGVLGRLSDGTPYYSPLGELVVDPDDDRAQCHLCGLWFRQLGSTHLPRAHGVTAERYRELVGLRPRHPLWAPTLIAARPVSLERARQLEQSGEALGSRRAERHRARRHAWAQALGYRDLAAYYRHRYGDDRLRLDQLADELHCSQSAVRGDLQRLGLGPDRARSHGARWRS